MSGDRWAQSGQQTGDQLGVPRIRHQPCPPGRGHVSARPRPPVRTHHGFIHAADGCRAHGHVGTELRLLWTHGHVQVLGLTRTQKGIQVRLDRGLWASDSKPVGSGSTLGAHGNITDLVLDL